MRNSILVVDDHEPNLFGLRDLLAAEGYRVRTATNGVDALMLAQDERPDLALLDVVMPGLSGVDVCAHLKSDQRTYLTPIVLVSGSAERDLRIAGLAAGADDFLPKPVDPEELRVRVRSLLRLKRTTDELESAEALFLTLGRIIEARDTYTEGHCERLARYATTLGRDLGLEELDLEALYRGGFLHDIGKIAVSDRVLLKTGPLTASEYRLMQTHPVVGHELCRSVRSLDRVTPIVRSHHERLDGSGYPDALRGQEIPLLAQIVAICDVFDALTTERPYRKAWPAEQALTTLLQEAQDGLHDVELVQRFAALQRSATTMDLGVHRLLAAQDGVPDGDRVGNDQSGITATSRELRPGHLRTPSWGMKAIFERMLHAG